MVHRSFRQGTVSSTFLRLHPATGTSGTVGRGEYLSEKINLAGERELVVRRVRLQGKAVLWLRHQARRSRLGRWHRRASALWY